MFGVQFDETTLKTMRLSLLVFFCVRTAVGEEIWIVEKLIAASYPTLAQFARVEGTVNLNCKIDDTGRVLECIADGGHPLLQKAAIENAVRWKCRKTEGSRAGQPEIKLVYEFSFSDAPPVRHTPKVEFTFEYPNHARIVSEVPCPDHLPCTASEVQQFKSKKKSKPLP